MHDSFQITSITQYSPLASGNKLIIALEAIVQRLNSSMHAFNLQKTKKFRLMKCLRKRVLLISKFTAFFTAVF